jgi:hypothetical protein
MKKTVFLVFFVFLFSFVIWATKSYANGDTFTQDEFGAQAGGQEEESITENSGVTDVQELRAADQKTDTDTASSQPDAKKNLEARSFIAPLNWVIDGTVIGDDEKRKLVSSNDIIFLNIGQNVVQPGNECTIYRKFKKVKDPLNGQVLGYEVHKIAKVRILEPIGESSSSARIIVSYDPVEAGDLVKIDK